MATKHMVSGDECIVDLLPNENDDVSSPSSWRLSLDTFRLPSSSPSARTRFSCYLRTPKKERRVSEYYKKQEELLEGFNEMETINETGFVSGAPTQDEIEKLAKSERLQEKLEQLSEVERAFVHIDFEFTHRPQHKCKV